MAQLISAATQRAKTVAPAAPHRNAALQRKGTELIDDAGALADQSFALAVWRLQIDLIDGLRRNEVHRWTLHSLGDHLGITEVVLLSP